MTLAALLFENENVKLSITAVEKYVVVEADGCRDPVVKVAEALAWLCAAVRDTQSAELVYSDVTTSKTSDTFEIQLSELKPLEQSKQSCWHSLFVNTVIAKGSFGRGRLIGNGLEIDFNTMTQLAAVEHPVKYDDGIVFLGYSTLLFPTKRHRDGSYQWHLETSKKGQIQLSRMDDFQDWFKIKTCNMEGKLTTDTKLEGTTAFLGWCKTSKVKLGTAEQKLDISLSTAKETKFSLEWDSVNLSGSLGFHAGPVNFGISLSSTSKIKANAYNHKRETNFGSMLIEARDEPLLLYDSGERRGWLVPKLCTILYMAHVYSHKKGLSKSSPVPLASRDGESAAYEAILHKSEMLMDAKQDSLKNEDAFLLKNYVQDSWFYMVAAAAHLGRKPVTANLKGFNLIDIALFAKNAPMLQQNVKNFDRDWTDIFARINMVIFCEKAGDVIAPGPQSNGLCEQCSTVPRGKDYLAASVQCLKRLARWDSNADALETMFPGLSFRSPAPAFEDCLTLGGSVTCITSRVQTPRMKNKAKDKGKEMESFQDIYNTGAVIIGKKAKKS